MLDPRRAATATTCAPHIARLAQLRAEKAKLLGYPNYAAWKLEDQMAKTPDAVLQFLNELIPAPLRRQRAEGKDIQAVIDAQHGGFQLQPWDWDLYCRAGPQGEVRPRRSRR